MNLTSLTSSNVAGVPPASPNGDNTSDAVFAVGDPGDDRAVHGPPLSFGQRLELALSVSEDAKASTNSPLSSLIAPILCSQDGPEAGTSSDAAAVPGPSLSSLPGKTELAPKAVSSSPLEKQAAELPEESSTQIPVPIPPSPEDKCGAEPRQDKEGDEKSSSDSKPTRKSKLVGSNDAEGSQLTVTATSRQAAAVVEQAAVPLVRTSSDVVPDSYSAAEAQKQSGGQAGEPQANMAVQAQQGSKAPRQQGSAESAIDSPSGDFTLADEGTSPSQVVADASSKQIVRSASETGSSIGATPPTSPVRDGGLQPTLSTTLMPGTASTAVTPVQSQGPEAAHAPTSKPRALSLRTDHVGSRVGIEIARSIAAGHEELTLRLDPVELGKVSFRMRFDEHGSLRAVVSAESTMVMEAIRRDAGDLSRTLQDAGIQTDSQSFRFDRNPTESGNGGTFSRRFDHRPASRISDDAAYFGSEEPVQRTSQVGRINLVA